MSDKKAVSTIRVDETLYEKIKYVAEQDHRSFNAEIEYVIAKFVLEFEKNNGEIILPKKR